DDIDTGRQVWQSIGGHHNGSIWGHGALLAPDWSAEWLHRETLAILDQRARGQFGTAYEDLDAGEQARLEAQVRPQMRANTYDPATGTITITDERAAAIDTVAAHYMSVFSADPATAGLRETYALRENPVPDMEHRRVMTAFFFWASWATVTERGDGTGLSYTHNFPHEPLVGNTP